MVKNYFRIAVRSILKKKVFSLINILGLATGSAAFLLLIQFVDFQHSFDKFHKEANSIYRVTLSQYLNNELMIASAENYPGVGPAMVSDISGVEGYARLYNMGYKNNIIITYEGAAEGPIAYKHRKFLYADSSFLPMFDYKMIKGDAETALAQPNSAVISEKYAQMYFGDVEPIGKMLRLKDDDYNDELCKVTGVFKDLPGNTHLKFDILFSYKTLYTRGDWAHSRYNESWERKDMYTYVKLQDSKRAKEVENQLASLVDKYSPDLSERNREDVLALQPLTSIHLNSNLAEEAEANSSVENVNAMLIIAFFIIILAWVNYINLSTSKAMERAKEVGVRKSLGAFRKQLISQFMIESIIINLISILVAFAFVILALAGFNDISGLRLVVADFLTLKFIGITFLLWLTGTLLSGIYPALVLSSFKPAVVLKGKLQNQSKGANLRKILVVFQFITSVSLIAGTLIVYNQLDYMQNKDIGMNVDQVLVVERPGIAPRDRNAFSSAIDVFRDEVRNEPNVEAISASVTIPGKKREFKVGAKLYGSGDDDLATLRFNSMDFSFIDVFEMNILAGRAFSEEFTNDPDTSVILTKSAAASLGFENPEDIIGQTIALPAFNWNPIVIGVVNDYNQESLQKSMDPIIFYCTEYGGEFYSMRVKTQNVSQTINHVEESWKKAFPGNPFVYFFLDDYFDRQYINEARFGNLFGAFSILAIFIGCLGLFGLSAYTVEQKTKEVGIRKVLGSKDSQIFILLSRSFVFLIGSSIAVAIPLTYFFMTLWLDSFAYKEAIPIWVFAASGISVLVVALVTISFQTIKAMQTNPVEALRYE